MQLPLQSLARSPPRGELKPVDVASSSKICRFVSPQGGLESFSFTRTFIIFFILKKSKIILKQKVLLEKIYRKNVELLEPDYMVYYDDIELNFFISDYFLIQELKLLVVDKSDKVSTYINNNFLMKFLTILILFLLAFVNSANAHSGRTNSSGCHNDNIHGGYHCHRGP